ncbi:GNAT family N-acetyltransferase [Rhodococcus sp. ARC_M6]|uniref:GNAT family N-acetyltransferase n=1 Tax=Rhodococcus sp. ARC_M6 TaxID=2928852 RepID=UPI001FB2BB65|nr:GNAT family N-acetyltransferase [Rhodococcus sp. ARC_M6]MCJ0902457.1 GNAT family N-acetyltransferase [Rhodococcus sp. ARC_M6]
METTVNVRRYRPSDEEAVIELWSQAAKLAHPFLDGEGEGAREAKMREIYLVHAENWIAETPEGVVGLLGLLGAEIGGLFVSPHAQRLGIGRLLVEHATALHGTVTLEVYELNESARRFYAIIGFQETGRHPDEETGHELIQLRRLA